MKLPIALLLTAALLTVAGPALAWGDLGHEVTALIAYRHLTPQAKEKLDQLLASDPDPLTAPDFASRATWADKYRNTHHETALWHYVDIEIDGPNLTAACFGFPAIPKGQPASQGPSRECVVNKINEFSAELHDPTTTPSETLLALKFLIHFVGDVHQPLHAADHHDRGGNCVLMNLSRDGAPGNLHAYWDTTVVESLGTTAPEIAAKLDTQITSQEIKAWSSGDAKAWAMQTYQVAKRDAYRLPNLPTCGESGSVTLSRDYQAMAKVDAARQLEAAGIRMAYVLNRALGS